MINHISVPCQWKFFESYARAIDLIDAQLGRAEAEHFLYALMEYSSWGRQPELDFENPTIAVAWELVKPNLDSSVKHHIDAAAGGRAKAAKYNNKGKEDNMTKEEIKAVRKMTKALANVYEATVVPEYDEDALIPDWDFEAHSAFISEEDEREREMYRAECDAFEMLG